MKIHTTLTLPKPLTDELEYRKLTFGTPYARTIQSALESHFGNGLNKDELRELAQARRKAKKGNK